MESEDSMACCLNMCGAVHCSDIAWVGIHRKIPRVIDEEVQNGCEIPNIIASCPKAAIRPNPKAKEKSLFYNSIVIFSLIVLFVIGVYIDNLMTLLLFVPIGIINLLYINKLNKKTQGKFKIVGEKVLTIIFTIASGLFGLLSLLIIL